jgi:phage shock protein PspC (stress-responsive transcriptional regulator)
MGKPEQYVDEDEEPAAEKTYTNQRTYSSAKKLFRDPDDRMIGGVASGIAAYFGVNKIWVRFVYLLGNWLIIMRYIRNKDGNRIFSG